MDKYTTFKPKLKILEKASLNIQRLLPRKLRRQDRVRLIAVNYFAKNGWDDMLKASEAFGLRPHTSHNFVEEYDYEIDNRFDKCLYCHRSRDDIRYEDKDPLCTGSAQDIILQEEIKYATLVKDKEKIASLFKKLGSDGKALSILHHTHGLCPEICAEVINITPELYKDYEDWMVKESQLSKSKQIKTVISVNDNRR